MDSCVFEFVNNAWVQTGGCAPKECPGVPQTTLNALLAFDATLTFGNGEVLRIDCFNINAPSHATTLVWYRPHGKDSATSQKVFKMTKNPVSFTVAVNPPANPLPTDSINPPRPIGANGLPP
jgi:hypothetical protein